MDPALNLAAAGQPGKLRAYRLQKKLIQAGIPNQVRREE